MNHTSQRISYVIVQIKHFSIIDALSQFNKLQAQLIQSKRLAKKKFSGLIQNYSKLYYVSTVYVFQGETWVYLHLLFILENFRERFSYKRACSNFFIWSFCFFFLRERGKSMETLSGFKSIEFSQLSFGILIQIPSETNTSDWVFNLFIFSENDLEIYRSLAIGINVFKCLSSTLLFIFSYSYIFDKAFLLIANFNWLISFTKNIRLLIHELPPFSLMLYFRIFNLELSSREASVIFLHYLCSNFVGEIDCKQRLECVKMISFQVLSPVLYLLFKQQLFFSKIYNLMDSIVRFLFLRKDLSFIYYIKESIRLYCNKLLLLLFIPIFEDDSILFYY